MPKKPKREINGTVEEDQKQRGYYYDDAHGYEEFKRDDDDDDSEIGEEEIGPERPQGPSTKGAR